MEYRKQRRVRSNAERPRTDTNERRSSKRLNGRRWNRRNTRTQQHGLRINESRLHVQHVRKRSDESGHGSNDANRFPRSLQRHRSKIRQKQRTGTASRQTTHERNGIPTQRQPSSQRFNRPPNGFNRSSIRSPRTQNLENNLGHHNNRR